MKTSGKILIGLMALGLSLSVFSAFYFHKKYTTVTAVNDITEVYSAIALSDCDTVISTGNVSIRISYSDTAKIRTVKKPDLQEDSILIVVKNGTLLVHSQDTMSKKTRAEVEVDLPNISQATSLDESDLYLVGFNTTKLKASAAQKSKLELRKLHSDTLYLEGSDQARLIVKNYSGNQMNVSLKDNSMAELLKNGNEIGELILSLKDQSMVKLKGNFTRMMVEKSESATLEVDKPKALSKNEVTVTVEASIDED